MYSQRSVNKATTTWTTLDDISIHGEGKYWLFKILVEYNIWIMKNLRSDITYFKLKLLTEFITVLAIIHIINA